MKAYLNCIILGVGLLLMVSCKPNIQTDDLILHPDQLQRAYDHCKYDASVECDQVRRVMQDFNALLTEQIMGPDQFGERIMHLQQQLLVLAAEKQQALRNKDEAKVKLSEQAYEDAERQLKIFYAVVKKVIIE